MRNNLTTVRAYCIRPLFAAILAVALAFTLSCSGGDDGGDPGSSSDGNGGGTEISSSSGGNGGDGNSSSSSLNTQSSSSATSGGNAGTYIITGSGTTFTATKNNATVGTANQAIQTVIDAIRTDANGANCTIQFGNLTNTLDIGTTSSTSRVNFTGTWGNITISGKIKASIASYTLISIASGISVTSTADIENNYATLTSGTATVDNSGTFTITSGKVTGTGDWNRAIVNSGTLTINGGTVSSIDITAIQNSGTVAINGGTVNTSGGRTIRQNGAGTITINGGTVEAEGTESAVYLGGGTVNIISGTVSAVSGHAVFNEGGTVTISGGTLSTTGNNGQTVYNTGSTATVTITGGTITATGTSGLQTEAVTNSYGTVTITNGTITAPAANAKTVRNSLGGTVTITTPPTVIDKTKTSGTITWLP